MIFNRRFTQIWGFDALGLICRIWIFYIFFENNFWITKNGNKDLMKNIPITAEEIEALMKR